MPIMEISLFPLGTGNASVSEEVAESLAVLKRAKGVRYQISSMATVVEAVSLRKLLAVAEQMHRAMLRNGARRVITTIKIDDRTDKPLSAAAKVQSVLRRLEERRVVSKPRRQ